MQPDSTSRNPGVEPQSLICPAGNP